MDYQTLLNDRKNSFMSSFIVINKLRSKDYRTIGPGCDWPCLIVLCQPGQLYQRVVLGLTFIVPSFYCAVPAQFVTSINN